MPNALRSSIAELAATFASSVLKAIRGASLDDILAETSTPARPASHGPGRPRGSKTAKPAQKAATPAPAPNTAAPSKKAATGPSKKATGRLARRSPAEIAKALAQVVDLVKKQPGLRAEQIRAELKMDRKEMPRVLKEGLSKKVLRSKGQKRSTTYSLA